jgi:hypothetical protein
MRPLPRHHAMKTCEEWIKLHAFLSMALSRAEWLVARSEHCTLWERVSSAHWIGGWLDLKSWRGCGDEEKKKYFCKELKPNLNQILIWKFELPKIVLSEFNS